MFWTPAIDLNGGAVRICIALGSMRRANTKFDVNGVDAAIFALLLLLRQLFSDTKVSETADLRVEPLRKTFELDARSQNPEVAACKF